MALYAIADTHLSFGTDKPMDSFPGWSDYTVRLAANWRHLVEPQDTVVIAGDISWAMKFAECTAVFAFLNDLPGQKSCSRAITTIGGTPSAKWICICRKIILILYRFCIIKRSLMAMWLCAAAGAGSLRTRRRPRTRKCWPGKSGVFVCRWRRQGTEKRSFFSISAGGHRERLCADRRTVAAVRCAKVLLRPSARRSRPVCF